MMNTPLEDALSRHIPDYFSIGRESAPADWQEQRAVLRDLIQREEYGIMPDAPTDTRAVPDGAPNPGLCAGKVCAFPLRCIFSTPRGEFGFPFTLFLPKHPKMGGKPPVIVFENFRPTVPDRCFPMEEITDQGYAVALIDYQEITADNDDFSSGLAGMYPGNSPVRDEHAWGKIAMWAFGASRVLDVLLQRDDIDTEKIVVTGHSRLGKTALLAAAMDDRFAGCLINGSGCSGTALTRKNARETVGYILRMFPYWFCPAYQAYADCEDKIPFDQDALTALIAPRLLGIGCAEDDQWADPQSEYLTAVLAGRAYTMLETGEIPTAEAVFSAPALPKDRFPIPGEIVNPVKNMHYHLRPGTHYYCRDDWNPYLAFLTRRFSCENP
ncbi:MAG: hypothetical protein MJ175_10355 [Clostridia bacterium]|nr:hypothetical protein [Clostridia bacterium]